MKQKKGLRDTIIAVISIALILCGGIGLHHDWTMWALVIPFGWVILGVLLDMMVNGNTQPRTKDSFYISILCTLILLNIGLIFVHRDTMFLLGRILCCTGASILIIRGAAQSNQPE